MSAFLEVKRCSGGWMDGWLCPLWTFAIRTWRLHTHTFPRAENKKTRRNVSITTEWAKTLASRHQRDVPPQNSERARDTHKWVDAESPSGQKRRQPPVHVKTMMVWWCNSCTRVYDWMLLWSRGVAIVRVSEWVIFCGSANVFHQRVMCNAIVVYDLNDFFVIYKHNWSKSYMSNNQQAFPCT